MRPNHPIMAGLVVPLCKDCDFARGYGDGYGWNWWCCTAGRPDPVTGANYPECWEMRKVGAPCGVEGKLFILKRPKPPHKRGWLATMLGLE